MCRYSGKGLNEVEQSLKKIKAIADLLSFHERDTVGFISGESLQEIGYLLADLAEKALEVFADDEAPAPEHLESEAA